MSSSQQIQYLRRHQVDTAKWDACIDKSSNGLIYGYSFYLDAMAMAWDALVLNDYECVMPLTWKSKFGIAYLSQPFTCASLGIFGNNITLETVADFMAAIPGKFRFIDISLNSGNPISQHAEGWQLRTNYVLPLSKPYHALQEQFNSNTKRNIKRALQQGCEAVEPTINEVISLAKNQWQQTLQISDADFHRFHGLYVSLEKNKAALTMGVADSKKQLLSAAAFFLWKNRAYYILAGNSASAKGTGASHLLLNRFIEQHASQNMVLDFEGSDHPGLSLFYSSFGASREEYPWAKINRLPFLLKWLKH